MKKSIDISENMNYYICEFRKTEMKEVKKMSIGKQIRSYLIEKDITQTWLSEQSKIALPKLNASLNNQRKMPVEEFASIINVLNVDANKFLNNEIK